MSYNNTLTVEQTIQLLNSDEIMILDTETIPGLSGNLTTRAKICQLKQKPNNANLCILINDFTQLEGRKLESLVPTLDSDLRNAKPHIQEQCSSSGDVHIDSIKRSYTMEQGKQVPCASSVIHDSRGSPCPEPDDQSDIILTSLEKQLLIAGRGQTTVITAQNIAIRLVTSPELIEILNQTGPVFSTSCNLHGQEPLLEPADNVFQLPYFKLSSPRMLQPSRLIRACPFEVIRY